MCTAEVNFADIYKPGPNYCPAHPDFDMGSRGMSPMSGFINYRHVCPHCIVDTIKTIPTDQWLTDYKIDPGTIQVVLDVLDQKFGLA